MSGDAGQGSFWVSSTDQGGQGALREFSATSGALLGTPRPFPAGCTGLGYDDTLGRFYGFSRLPQPTPSQPIQVNGFEVSAYDFAPTGVRFCGDLTLGNGAGPRGGVAAGFDVFRSRAAPTAQLTMVCLVDTPNNPQSQQWLYELKTPAALRSYASVAEVAGRLLQNNPRLDPAKAAWLAPHWSRRRDDGRWHLLADPAHKRVNPVPPRQDADPTWGTASAVQSPGAGRHATQETPQQDAAANSAATHEPAPAHETAPAHGSGGTHESRSTHALISTSEPGATQESGAGTFGTPPAGPRPRATDDDPQ